MIKNNIYTCITGRLTLPQFQMFGFILIFIGGYLLFLTNWFGIIALLIGVVLYMAKTGIQIDFENNLHREFISLTNYKFGKWVTLPEIEYVTVFIEHTAQRGSVASIDKKHEFSKFKISLIVSKTIKFDAGLFTYKNKVLETAKIIAKNLNAKLLDYTEREPRWVDLD